MTVVVGKLFFQVRYDDKLVKSVAAFYQQLLETSHGTCLAVSKVQVAGYT